MTTGTMNQRGRAPRYPRADGERTRGAILRAAASPATVDGLEGLSIGHLAAATGISKSGLYADSGSQQELQLATVAEAERILDRRSHPARARGPSRPSPAGGRVRGVLQLRAAPRLPRRLLLRRHGAGDGHPPRAGQGPGRRHPLRVHRAAAVLRGHRAGTARASRPRGPRRLASNCTRSCWPPTPNSSCTTTRPSWTWPARSSASGSAWTTAEPPGEADFVA